MVALSIITQEIPPAQATQAYSQQMQVVGGVPPYSWQVAVGFGSLPAGMSLSAAGLLSAAAGAISSNSVGVYSFRLEGTDSTPVTVFRDVVIEVVPHGYDRIPGFLLDDRFRSLVSRLPSLPVDREKVVRHFFRSLIGVMGDVYAHYDEDIYCPDWETPGTNISLRDVLDDLDSEVGASVKTVNTVVPDPVGDFSLVAGLGVAITPVVNGLQIDATAASGPIDIKATEAVVVPGGTIGLTLTTDEYVAQLWVRTSGNTYMQAGNIPDYAGKKLFNSIALNSGGRAGMAPGHDGLIPVVHVAWDDGATVELARFDALTLDLLERVSIGAGGLMGPPLVMVTADSKVVVAFIAGGQLFYGVYNPANYADVTIPAYLNPAIPILAGAPQAPNYTGKIVGAVSPIPAEAYIGCLWAPGNTSWVGQFDTVNPGATGGYIGRFSPAAGGYAGILDIVIDSVTSTGYVIETDALAVPGNLILWYFSVPFFGTSVGNTVLDTSAPALGTAYKGAVGMIGASVPNPGSRAINVAFLFEDSTLTPMRADLRTVYTDQVEPPAVWPAAPLAAVTVVRPQSCNSSVFSFLKLWELPGENKGVYVESSASTIEGDLRRLVFSLDRSVVDSDVLVFNFEEASWLVPGFTSETSLAAQDLRIFSSLDVFGAVEPGLTTENLYLEFNNATRVLLGHNESPFTWNLKLMAEESSGLPPENLLIACYQFSQAMRNYFTATGWYPSPSAVAGVLWTEAQVAGTPVGGFAFSSYYSVTPGQYDLHSGTIAQGWYMADEPATTALDYTFVFRYNYMPTSILAAEAVIKAAIDAFLLATPPLPHGTGVNPNFYTLAELDAILGTTFATTYAGAPFDYYRYFLFTDVTGLLYRQGWYSSNYVDTGVAYGPHPGSNSSIPISEHFTVTVPGVATVPDYFALANSVSAARVYVNGLMYLEGIDWQFSGMNTIEYLNRMPGGYVLNIGDVVTVEKYIL